MIRRKKRIAFFIGLSLCGLVVAACIGCYAVVVWPYTLFPLPNDDTTAIESRFDAFCDAFEKNDYVKTYDFMTVSYRQENPLDLYVKKYKDGSRLELLAIRKACQNPKIPKGSRLSARMAQWEGEGFIPIDEGAIVDFAKENGVWYIEDASYQNY